MILTGLTTSSKKSKLIEKGQPELLSHFIEAALGHQVWPIELWQQIQATEMAIEVEKQIVL